MDDGGFKSAQKKTDIFENSNNGDLITVAWSAKGKKRIKLDFDVKEAISRDGECLQFSDYINLSSSPVYLIHNDS